MGLLWRTKEGKEKERGRGEKTDSERYPTTIPGNEGEKIQIRVGIQYFRGWKLVAEFPRNGMPRGTILRRIAVASHEGPRGWETGTRRVSHGDRAPRRKPAEAVQEVEEV